MPIFMKDHSWTKTKKNTSDVDCRLVAFIYFKDLSLSIVYWFLGHKVFRLWQTCVCFCEELSGGLDSKVHRG